MVVLEALAAYGLYNIINASTGSETKVTNMAPRQEVPRKIEVPVRGNCPPPEGSRQPTGPPATVAVPVGTPVPADRRRTREFRESCVLPDSAPVPSVHPSIMVQLQNALHELQHVKAAAAAAEERLAQQVPALQGANATLAKEVQGLRKTVERCQLEELRLRGKLQAAGKQRKEVCLVGAAQTAAITLLIHLPLAMALSQTVQKVSTLRANGRLQVTVDWKALARSITRAAWAVRVDGPSAQYQPTRSPAAELDCTVCHDNQRDVLLQPCRHLAVCWPCSKALAASAQPQCPLCRQEITAIQYAVVA